MGQFEASVRGIADACRALEIPVVSGNVSFYNETDGRAIPPTPTVGMVGLIEDVSKHVRVAFRRAGDLVAVLGATRDELGASEFLRTVRGRDEGPCPEVDLDAEKRLVDLLATLAERGLVASAHDVSDGGLACAIAESAIAGGIGCEVNVEHLRERGAQPEEALFGEGPGGFLVSGDRAALEELGATLLGEIGGEQVSIGAGDRSLSLSLAEAERAWRSLPAQAEGDGA